MNKKIHFIGIWWIGISALARYYLSLGYTISGSDGTDSELIQTLIQEWMDIKISSRCLNYSVDKVIYTEAIPEHNSDLEYARENNIETLTYPQALAEVANTQKLITIAGTHGKSTTTSLASLVLKNSQINFSSIVGSLLKEFDGKNFYTTGNSEFFVIEACEYKRSFLTYKPTVAVITNIELDHLDYYDDLDDYLSAYEEYINHVVPGGFVILNGNDKNCKKLLNKRADLSYIELYNSYFTIGEEKIEIPEIEMQVPWSHILYDAHIAYIIGHMLGINDRDIVDALENYTGIWRRMEYIGTTEGNNILMSDYGHHPTEISLTLSALKEKYPEKKLFTIFQPHQYSRTLELLEDFKTCFDDADSLIIPNIYESRDSQEDMDEIDSEKLAFLIEHSNVINGGWLENTLELIKQYDTSHSDNIILILWAGDVDNLRYKLKTK